MAVKHRTSRLFQLVRKGTNRRLSRPGGLFGACLAAVPSLAAVTLAVALLAGCGSLPAGSAAPTTATTRLEPRAPSSAGAGTGEAVAVTVGRVDGRRVLLAPGGRPLYRLASETAGGVGGLACTGACTRTWQPLLLPGGDLGPVGAASLAGRLGVVTRPDGGRQVTYQGSPLYLHRGGGPIPAGWSLVAVSG